MSAPLPVAHRGYPARYPENSLVGIEAAVAAGARFVEIDVQMSMDGVPVVLHDADLQRTASRAGNAPELRWDELRRIEIGEPRRFGGSFLGELLPSLERVVELISGSPGVHLFVEIKRDSLHRHGVEAVTRSVLAALAPLRGRVSIISFDEACLRLARDLGTTPIGWILEAVDETSRHGAETLAPELLFCNRRLLPDAPEPPWSGPWSWAVYTLDDPAEAASLARRGVSFVETDDIGAMLSR